jgi:hypothetical protein
MARPKVMPKLRPSYANDAHYLVRLAASVESDTEQPMDWRRTTVALLQEAAGRLAVVGIKKGE